MEYPLGVVHRDSHRIQIVVIMFVNRNLQGRTEVTGVDVRRCPRQPPQFCRPAVVAIRWADVNHPVVPEVGPADHTALDDADLQHLRVGMRSPWAFDSVEFDLDTVNCRTWRDAESVIRSHQIMTID